MRRKRRIYRTKQHQENGLGLGIILKGIARKAIEDKYPELSEKEIEQILAHNDMEEVRSIVDIQWVIERIVEVIRAELAEEGIRLPSDFAEVLIYSETPEEDVEEVVVEVKLRGFSDEEKDALRKDVLLELASILLCDSLRVVNQVYLEDVFRLLELDTGRELEELY